ncbi:hypothetical protein PFISCL1PPCAC_9364, partial [Pristionchus fissidentatus]
PFSTMGCGAWVLALLSLLALSDARFLKMHPILTTTTAEPDEFVVVDEEPATVPGTVVPVPTTRETSIDQLVAFTDSNNSTHDMVVDILRTGDNETMSLDEFDVSDNVTTVSALTAPRTTTSVPKGMIRMCQCTEVLACQLEARNDTSNCFETCDQQLEFLGNETASYADCFEQNQDGVNHAEACLESALGEFCSTSLTPQYTEARPHEESVKTKFIASKEPKKSRPLLHRTHHLLAGFQEYYHCTKQCVHKRMLGCFRKKSCSVRLPPVSTFGDAMNKCAKNNVKVSRSLRSTCQCLLHKKGLKQLTGSCAVINPFRVRTV